MPVGVLASYECRAVEIDGVTRDVFTKGQGPGVIVMAEIPGITPKVIEFADRVVVLGCTVWLPRLFGEAGREMTAAYTVRSIVPACVSREFSAFATGRTTPVALWLRELARRCHAECGGPGVGAVGMCFTGGFALGMMVDRSVIAPVMSQPSVPIGVTRRQRRDLGISPADLAVVKERTVADGVCVLALRFSHDPMAPAERFETLRRELGDAFIGVEIDSSRGNPYGHPLIAHSVLTEHLIDEPGQPTHDALHQVLDFLGDRLLPS